MVVAPLTFKECSVTQLHPMEKEFTQSLVTRSGIKGVLVGAIVGSVPMEIRPLVLQGASTFIIRPLLVDPKRRSELLANLKDIYTRLAGGAWGERLSLSHGYDDKGFWSVRRYFPQTLSPEAPREVLLRLFEEIKNLHHTGVLHGHLTPTNIAVLGESPVLLDHGLRAYSGIAINSRYLAPELRSGGIPTLAADIYSLGILLKEFKIDRGDPLLADLLQLMVQENPKLRPSIVQVISRFGPLPAAHAPRVPLIETPARGGKILSGVVKVEDKPTEVSPVPSDTTSSLTITVPPIVEASSPFTNQMDVAETVFIPLSPSRPPEAAPPPLPPKEEKRVRPAEIEQEEFPEELESSEEPHSTPPPPRAPRPEGGGFIFTILGVVAVIIGIWWSRSNDSEPSVPYRDYWKSREIALITRTAEDAVQDPNSAAARAVIQSALEGFSPPEVRRRLIAGAFHPLWRNALSAEDKAFALKIALLPLLKKSGLTTAIELPQSAHPGLLFALAGDLPRTTLAAELSKVSVDELGVLSSPYGEVFEGLKELGVDTLADLPARSAAHLILGDVSEDWIAPYFAGDEGETEIQQITVQRKLELLLPFTVDVEKGLGVGLHAHLRTSDLIVGTRLRWFEENEVGGWREVPAQHLLMLSTAQFPEGLSPEQLADLLNFPSVGVRAAALKALEEKLGQKGAGAMASILSSNATGLSRSQIVLLVAALTVKGEAAYPFTESWFKTEPSANTVAVLLAASSGADEVEAFTVEAARYLKDKEWHSSDQILETLLGHQDLLVRSIALARISPKTPEHKKILQKLVRSEPNAALRKRMEELLAP